MQRAYDVFLNGKEIDTVFAVGYDAEEMRRSLINHDGYNPGICVYRRAVNPTSRRKYDDSAPNPEA
jgi:hypothetical protein